MAHMMAKELLACKADCNEEEDEDKTNKRMIFSDKPLIRPVGCDTFIFCLHEHATLIFWQNENVHVRISGGGGGNFARAL